MEALCRALWRRRDRPVRVAVCFDVEPDDRVVDRDEAKPWRGFEETLELIPPLRARLAAASGAPVAFTWFIRMDPQIAETWGDAGWAATHYADAFASLAEAGDELAIHLHSWRWDAAGGRWVVDRDPTWMRECVATGLAAFEAAFGRPPALHRAGDHYLNGAVLTQLADGGVTVDMTVEPGGSPKHFPDAGGRVGLSPDYRGLPLRPYRTTPERFPAPVPGSEHEPLIVPIVGPAREGRWRRALLLAEHPSVFAVRLLGELLRGPPPVLAFVLRTDPPHLAVWDLVTRNLEQVARHPGVRLVTGSEAARGARPDRSPRRFRPLRSAEARTP